MQRLFCETCRTTPPPSAKSFDRCATCAGPVQREVRCPWCTLWAKDTICGACGAEILAPQDFGAARFLVEGGVDRFVLPERVRGLSRNQHTMFSSKFDLQWSALQVRIDEARFAEGYLVTKGHAAEIEDLLIGRIPYDPQSLEALIAPPHAPFELLGIGHNSPLYQNRTLAAIAAVHARVADREADQLANSALYGGDRLAPEAAFALSRWSSRARIDRYNRERWLEVVTPLLKDRVLAPWAAIAAAQVWQYNDRFQELIPLLREGISTKDLDLRLTCALLLKEEVVLRKFLDHSDEEMRGVARRALAEMGSIAVVGELKSAGAARQVLRALEWPLPAGMFEALLKLIASGDPEARIEGLAFLKGRRFAELEPEQRALLGQWVSSAGLDLQDSLQLLEWAVAVTEYNTAPRADQEIQPYVRAVTPLLRAASPVELFHSRSTELQRWLHAVPVEEARPVLDLWMTHDAALEQLLEQLVELHARVNGYNMPSNDRALDHLLGLFDRKPSLGAAIGRVLARHTGMSGKERLIAAFWDRFQRFDDRRREVMQAIGVFEYEVRELRKAELSDPVRFFTVFSAADPEGVPAIAREAIEAVPPGDPSAMPALMSLMIEHVLERVAQRPCTELWALATIASQVVNRYRDDPENVSLRSAVENLERVWPRITSLIAAPQPVEEKEGRFSHLVEQIETELRIVSERRARIEEARRREEERAEEQRRREEERVRQQEEASRAQALREQAAQENAAKLASLSPEGEPQAIDQQLLLPEQPLPTLVSYVRFIKSMSSGGDIMALFSAAGLTPQSWAACSAAWTGILTTRMDVALRFGALMSAQWR